MAAMTIFERLRRPQPAPTEAAIEQPPQEPAQLLLNWLQRREGSTITWKQIRNHGPRRIRAPEIAIRSAQVLVAHDWLKELKPHQWQIIRQPLIPTSIR